VLAGLVSFAALVACGGSDGAKSPAQGHIDEVVVVLKGSDEPLPFDPRGGRLTIVTGEITKLVGHAVVLELDAALSPELKASLEETVLASFETYARELVLLQREDAAMFAEARKIDRIVCKYDAVATESKARLEESGARLVVDASPDRFPLLEPWIVTRAIYGAHVDQLEARWGSADPTKLSPREQAAWFDYMTSTRPGAGYLWIAARRKLAANANKEGKEDDLRLEHILRISRLAFAVQRGSALDKDVTQFMLENASHVGGYLAKPPHPGFHADPSLVQAAATSYEKWLVQRAPTFGDEQRLRLARALFERQGICGRECSPDAVFPGFDRLAFGMSVYDDWVKNRSPMDGPPGPRFELYKKVVCPQTSRGEAETEIRYGCSSFFGVTLSDDVDRGRLATMIDQRHDARLLENALLNLAHAGGPNALALVESLRDETLQRRGLSILFHDLARRDDVKSALEKAAPRWWRDVPRRRGYALLVLARGAEELDPHYGDNHWQRFTAEFGGPVGREVFGQFLAEGPRAADMVPKMWVALAKGADRDELVARSVTMLLERDRALRSSRTGPALLLLRKRYCDERSERGFGTVRAALDQWASAHPDDAASVSNARADFRLARCPKAPEDNDR
jgi:hypothetical protein